MNVVYVAFCSYKGGSLCSISDHIANVLSFFFCIIPVKVNVFSQPDSETSRAPWKKVFSTMSKYS